MRDNFIRSHAVHCIVGWILSLADRHSENLLISTITGRSIPIDFGQAFGYTAFLPVPELSPFRLTPQMVRLMMPLTPDKGLFREAMVRALRILRLDSEVLNAAFSVFIEDMTKDWVKLATHKASKATARDQAKIEEEFPVKKMQMVEMKLKGIHPSEAMIQELQFGGCEVEVASEVLYGQLESKRRQCEDQDCLSVEDQVDCLIEAATDPSLLSCAYAPWLPLC